jgi:hypothetical protein
MSPNGIALVSSIVGFAGGYSTAILREWILIVLARDRAELGSGRI